MEEEGATEECECGGGGEGMSTFSRHGRVILPLVRFVVVVVVVARKKGSRMSDDLSRGAAAGIRACMTFLCSANVDFAVGL